MAHSLLIFANNSNLREASRAHCQEMLIRLNQLNLSLESLPKQAQQDLARIILGTEPEMSTTDIAECINALQPSLLTCKKWLILCMIYYLRGKYIVANSFREKSLALAAEAVVTASISPPVSWKNSLAAAIEKNLIKEHRDLSTFLQRFNASPAESESWHDFFGLIEGIRSPHTLVQPIDDESYSAYLDDKSVALVVPSKPSHREAICIDNNDIVIRFNHSHHQKGTDPVFKGMRTNASNFNGTHAESFFKEGTSTIPAELDWVSFKSSQHADHARSLNPTKHCRTLKNFNRFTFFGTFNALPIAILDLLSCNNRIKITVFHADLFLTVDKYENYYPSTHAWADTSIIDSYRNTIAHHDPVLQYRFLSKLWQQGRISGDSVFQGIMNQGLLHYLGNMEDIYGVL